MVKKRVKSGKKRVIIRIICAACAIIIAICGINFRGSFTPLLSGINGYMGRFLLLTVCPEMTATVKKYNYKYASALPESTTVAPTTAKPTAPPTTAKPHKISAETLGYDGANLTARNIHITNLTGAKVNLSAQMKIAPEIEIYNNHKPQVLIVHTHATECFYPKVSDTYSNKWATRSTDNSKNVVALGDIIAARLNNAHIMTIHDKTQYDRDEYSGSYERARVKTAAYLKKYPSIDVVLDIHRDAITYDSGTKVRPVANIGGRTAAQIMICCGSNTGDVTDYDNWLSNFRFAVRLQRRCEERYAHLARPLYFVSKKYNHDLCGGSSLIEVGSEANTLDEAKYSAELISNVLIDVLCDLRVED